MGEALIYAASVFGLTAYVDAKIKKLDIEKERYNALNVLLGNVLSHLNLLDNTLKDKLDLIFSGIVVNAFHFVSTEKIKDFAEINYKDFYKLDKDSLEQLFLEYLDYIKAPQDWYEKFSYLRRKSEGFKPNRKKKKSCRNPEKVLGQIELTLLF